MGAVRDERGPRRRRVRLHWTHPDWRPWRRYAREEARETPSGPRGDDAVPVVDGVRLVKLPWTHPRWRPWRRYARPEAGPSIHWLSLALLALVGVALVAGAALWIAAG